MKGRVTKTGYRRNSPDVNNDYNIIPSNRISMAGVDFPVLGIDNLGNAEVMYPGGEYEFQGDYVTELPAYGSGGLTQWFAEEWVDIKTGKKCGRSGKDKKGRPYPACRPSKRVNKTTPKTSKEMSAKEKAKFKKSKTSKKRINYNHKRAQEGIEVGNRFLPPAIRNMQPKEDPIYYDGIVGETTVTAPRYEGPQIRRLLPGEGDPINSSQSFIGADKSGGLSALRGLGKGIVKGAKRMAGVKSPMRNTVISPYSAKLDKTLYAPQKVYGRGMPNMDAEMTMRGELVEQYNARNNAYHTVNITDDIRNNEYLRNRARTYGYNPDSDRDLALFLGTSPGGVGRRTGYENILPEGFDFLYSGNNPIQTFSRYGEFGDNVAPFTTKFKLFNDNTSMLSDRQLFERIQALDGVNTYRPDLGIKTLKKSEDLSSMVQGQIINTNSLHVPGLNQTNIMVGRKNIPVRDPIDIRSAREMSGWPSVYELGDGRGQFKNPADYDFYFKQTGGQQGGLLPKAQTGKSTGWTSNFNGNTKVYVDGQKGFDDWDEYQYRNTMYNDSLMAANMSNQALAYLSQKLDPSIRKTAVITDPTRLQKADGTLLNWGKAYDKLFFDPDSPIDGDSLKGGDILPMTGTFASDVMETPSIIHKFSDIDIVEKHRIPLSINDYILINKDNVPISEVMFYAPQGVVSNYDYNAGPGVSKGTRGNYPDYNTNDFYDYRYIPEANDHPGNNITVRQYQRPNVKPVFTGTKPSASKPSATKTVAPLPTKPAFQPEPVVENTPVKEKITKTVKATPVPTMDIYSRKLNQQTGEYIYETSEGNFRKKIGPEDAAFVKENMLAIDNLRKARANKKAGGEKYQTGREVGPPSLTPGPIQDKVYPMVTGPVEDSLENRIVNAKSSSSVSKDLSRRDALLNASKRVSEGQGGRPLEVLLNMTAVMENSLGNNPNAYGRDYTRSQMSIDDNAYADLFKPRGEYDYTSSQKKGFEWLKGMGYEPAKMDSILRTDDPVAAMAAARLVYGRAPDALPNPDDPKDVYNYYMNNYNKSGALKYGDDEKHYKRFLDAYNDLYGKKEYGGQALPDYTNYDSQERAWFAARKELGKGKMFMYGGQKYTTSTPKGL